MKFIKTLTFITVLQAALLFTALPGLAAGDRFMDPDTVKAFYAERGGEFYWLDSGGLSDNADALIAALDDSWTHGLNPATYHAEKIAALEDKTDPESRAQLELVLTDAFIRYFRDLSGMRIKAAVLDLDPADWLQPYSVQESLNVLTGHRDISGVLEALPPKSATYRQLQKELERLVQEPAEPYRSVLPISLGGVSLQPAQRHKKIPDLRLRLNVRPQTTDPWLYDDRLAAAIMKFQQQSGLPSDGIIGPTTLKLLNRSNEGRMLQIIANLERLRWVDEQRPERFVLVNIPAATLWAVENQRVAFQMPVVVGRKERATQSFIANIEGVRFNPGWTVPPTIKREDILPKLIENPDYLADKGMELIYTGSEGQQSVDPRRVDWEDITPQELSQFEMVQIPGSHNPLGRIRILMPNKYNIYLHDTNQPEYFDRTQRAQSSGCIRMKEPEKMAEFVMKNAEGWDVNKMDRMISGGATRDVKIAEPIPVYIMYYSAWSDEQGHVVFGNDIYDLDKKLIAELRKIDGFVLPVHNSGALAGSGQPEFASVQ